ncbi:hypothetical protein D3C81_1767630 [compost metagenome]
MTLLSFDAVLGGRADQQALEANRLAAVVAPAEAVFLDALKGLFQLRQHALVAIDRVHQPGALFFNGSRVSRVGRGVQAFDGDAVLFDALMGFDFHVLQQLGEKSMLLGIHVVIRRHGQQLVLCH